MKEIRTAVAFFLLVASSTKAGVVDVAFSEYSKTRVNIRPFLRTYVLRRVPELKVPKDPEAWKKEASQLRQAIFKNVVYRGVPESWRRRVRWTYVKKAIEQKEYVIRLLRYEALPGLWIPALLYEPKGIKKKVPAVLNVNGHDGRGKAAPYKQIRCINQAKRGIIALNVEWLGMGQLRGPGFRHGCSNQLELLGVSALAPFYLSMEKALDLLLSLPHVDPSRIAVTGLSGGGWQTIFISSLDQRVSLANPVAGYSATKTRAFYESDLGDSEQAPTDFATIADYTHLTALRAPRPTLLTYNARDDCCFAAGHALGPLIEASYKAFSLLGRPQNLRWYVNHYPGTHNFERPNREAFYRALRDFFFNGSESFSAEEIDVRSELKSAEDLNVPLPQNNMDFNKIAISLLGKAEKAFPIPQEDSNLRREVFSKSKEVLAEILRWERWGVCNAEVNITDFDKGMVYVFELELPQDFKLPVVIAEGRGAKKTVILMSDRGAGSVRKEAEKLFEERSRVVLFDPVFVGRRSLRRMGRWALLVQSVGGRPLGIQASELSALCDFLKDKFRAQPLELHAFGPRTGLLALVGGSLLKDAVQGIEVKGCLGSLREVITRNWYYEKAPELFCPGLLKFFDIKELEALSQRG